MCERHKKLSLQEKFVLDGVAQRQRRRSVFIRMRSRLLRTRAARTGVCIRSNIGFPLVQDKESPASGGIFVFHEGTGGHLQGIGAGVYSRRRWEVRLWIAEK